MATREKIEREARRIHLASAVVMGADYFCITDDRLLRRAREVNTEATRIVTPLELAQELNL